MHGRPLCASGQGTQAHACHVTYTRDVRLTHSDNELPLEWDVASARSCSRGRSWWPHPARAPAAAATGTASAPAAAPHCCQAAPLRLMDSSVAEGRCPGSRLRGERQEGEGEAQVNGRRHGTLSADDGGTAAAPGHEGKPLVAGPPPRVEHLLRSPESLARGPHPEQKHERIVAHRARAPRSSADARTPGGRLVPRLSSWACMASIQREQG